MGVVQGPVDCGGGEGLGHDRVEAGGVLVRGDGHGAPLVGRVHDAVERFGGSLPGGQHADVVDHDELGAALRFGGGQDVRAVLRR